MKVVRNESAEVWVSFDGGLRAVCGLQAELKLTNNFNVL